MSDFWRCRRRRRAGGLLEEAEWMCGFRCKASVANVEGATRPAQDIDCIQKRAFQLIHVDTSRTIDLMSPLHCRVYPAPSPSLFLPASKKDAKPSKLLPTKNNPPQTLGINLLKCSQMGNADACDWLVVRLVPVLASPPFGIRKPTFSFGLAGRFGERRYA